jgi:hypothetical protein
MSRVRVHNFSISIDGFATGATPTLEATFGHAGERLHEWLFATRFWGEMIGQPGGDASIDNVFARRHAAGEHVEIMGAGKFGPPGWQEDEAWMGWWWSEPAVSHAHVHPDPSAPPTRRNGGRHHVPLYRCVAGRRA